jgi:hypothetical protein
MEQAENYITIGGFVVVLVFWAFIGIKYLRAWKELEKAFLESGMEWPFHSQKEINETFRSDLVKGYKITGTGMSRAFKIFFFMRTDNPVILKPLRSMRRALLTFILSPFLFAFVLIVIYAFFVV